MGLSFDEIDNLTIEQYNKLQVAEIYKSQERQSHIRDIEFAVYHAQGATLKTKQDLYRIPLIDNNSASMPITTNKKAQQLINRVLSELERNNKPHS